MGTYSYAQLEGLWIQAGGPPAVAPIMAAIALAESGGSDIMQQGQPAATTGCGIWQITPAEPGCLDAATNAQQAVAKYNSQGLSAWTTYTQGTYKKFLSPGTAPSSVLPGQAQAASLASSTSRGPGPCVWAAGSFCMDGLIGWVVAAGGVGLMGLGLVMAGRVIL